MLDEHSAKIRFGNFIKEGREKQHLYQSQVAESVSISQQYYSQIENGARNVDLVLALKICESLHLKLNDFIKTFQNETP